MTNPKIGGLAVRGGTPYNAAAHIYQHGPQTRDQLFAVIDFGGKLTHMQDKLDRALASGWLVQVADGQIDCGAVAREYFAHKAGEQDDKPLGQIAAPRQQPNVFTRPPLSKRHIPNPRGLRQDIPEWSVRAGASFKSLAGGE